MAEPLKACIDRVMPKELESVARATHAREHQLRAPSPFELALVSQKMWKPGRTLRIRFLDGEPAVHARIEEHAREWLDHANLEFEFGDDPDAEIRISFTRRGYWSALGTDALVEQYFPRTEPTMNFGGFSMSTPDEEYARVVLHEFGHALGCIHEHSSPAGGIKWNRDVVYRDLGGPPNNWDRATVDRNVFAVYDKTITQFTAFDPESIMLYSFPREWTLDGMTFSTNRELSETDKQFIASRYPASEALGRP
jgi:hypothetical protein